MHTLWNRANNVFTLASIVAAVLALLVNLTEIANTPQLPQVQASVTKLIYLTRNRDGDDTALLTMKLQADLTPYWSWNTKLIFVFLQAEYATTQNKLNQVSLWDDLLLKKRSARLKHNRLQQEYFFVDQGRNLRGRELNLTLTWNVVPRVGLLRTFSQTVPAGKFPAEYVKGSQSGVDWGAS